MNRGRRHFEALTVTCKGKRRYESFALAKHEARNTRRHRDRSVAEAYKCKHCNGFHIGSNWARPKPKPEPEVD